MKVFFAFLFVISLVRAEPRVTVEEWGYEPYSLWEAMGTAPSDALLDMTIAVKQQNTELLERTLLELSDPSSPNYGQWMSVSEVHSLVAPSAESIQIVDNWLEDAGVNLSKVSRTPNSDLISFQTTILVASGLVGAKYAVWKHAESGVTIMRVGSSSYSVPEKVKQHIDFVAPAVRFPTITLRKSLAEPEPEVIVTPAFLQTLYNTTGYTASNKKTQVAVIGMIGQYFEQSDLDKFFSKYDTASVGRKPNVVGYDGTQAGTEANLDIQYAMAMGAGVNSTFWSIAANSSDPFITLCEQLYAAGNPPTVMSISYGENEDVSQIDYYNRVNTEFQKVGAIGITMLSASGDGGVGGGQPSLCLAHFIPTFPGASPYITAVGGTQGSPESGASFSSGGFSNVSPSPSYQQAAIKNYLSIAKDLPTPTHYNASGNGFPDVSAAGTDFIIVNAGFSAPVSGTSCASPTFAGVVSLVNDMRLNAGKSTLGFMNPFIYANPDIFNDVTTGHNPGCFTEGFYCAQGWDPVTGMGTPNFKNFATAALALP